MSKAGGHLLAEIAFEAATFEWRGPAPFVFAAIPSQDEAEVRYAAREASYGWGVVPVQAEVNGCAFTTSLFPRDGGYLLPIKREVQRSVGLVLGETVSIRIAVYTR